MAQSSSTSPIVFGVQKNEDSGTVPIAADKTRKLAWPNVPHLEDSSSTETDVSASTETIKDKLNRPTKLEKEDQLKLAVSTPISVGSKMKRRKRLPKKGNLRKRSVKKSRSKSQTTTPNACERNNRRLPHSRSPRRARSQGSYRTFRRKLKRRYPPGPPRLPRRRPSGDKRSKSPRRGRSSIPHKEAQDEIKLKTPISSVEHPVKKSMCSLSEPRLESIARISSELRARIKRSAQNRIEKQSKRSKERTSEPEEVESKESLSAITGKESMKKELTITVKKEEESSTLYKDITKELKTVFDRSDEVRKDSSKKRMKFDFDETRLRSKRHRFIDRSTVRSKISSSDQRDTFYDSTSSSTSSSSSSASSRSSSDSSQSTDVRSPLKTSQRMERGELMDAYAPLKTDYAKTSTPRKRRRQTSSSGSRMGSEEKYIKMTQRTLRTMETVLNYKGPKRKRQRPFKSHRPRKRYTPEISVARSKSRSPISQYSTKRRKRSRSESSISSKRNTRRGTTRKTSDSSVAGDTSYEFHCAAAPKGRERGKIKFFDPQRGWGMIETPGKPDIFVHRNNITWVTKRGNATRGLKEGTKVEYTPSEEGNEDKKFKKYKAFEVTTWNQQALIGFTISPSALNGSKSKERLKDSSNNVDKSIPIVPICKYWIHGSCYQGSNCSWRHPLNVANNQWFKKHGWNSQGYNSQNQNQRWTHNQPQCWDEPTEAYNQFENDIGELDYGL